ncbi:MAG TPA: AAA family ATPase [Sedimentisphaerales bacterium]|jgi:adenylate kinase|nr:AAA family ATPase [Sedimentisphaerales bacterium]
MIIVVTGMVGLNKKSYLEAVCRFAGRNGQQVELRSVGDMMYAEAPDVPPGKILDISLKRLDSLRRSVFKDIIAVATEVPNLIVNTHATFRWRHGLFPAVDFDQMRQLNADMYICLIDGVVAMHLRLLEQHAVEHSLKDLIVWREEEIISTEMLCKGINDQVPFYCLSLGATEPTVDTFYRLAFRRDIKRAYLSFPMTAVARIESVTQEIVEFRRRMKESFICFDPGDLEEAHLPTVARAAQEQGLKQVEVTASNCSARLDVDEVLQIEHDINSQIYARDFLLIDQADMIVSFVPALPDGRAAISSGVERELQHAHEAAKEVYVIWTARQQHPSVFVTQTASKVFSSVPEAMEFLQKRCAR